MGNLVLRTRNVQIPFIFLLVFAPNASLQSKTNITVGLLAPFTGSWDRAPRFASAVSIAIDYINLNTSILPGYQLQYKWHDSGCSQSGGVGGAITLLREHVNVFIGPACSRSCVHGGYVAASQKSP